VPASIVIFLVLRHRAIGGVGGYQLDLPSLASFIWSCGRSLLVMVLPAGTDAVIELTSGYATWSAPVILFSLAAFATLFGLGLRSGNHLMILGGFWVAAGLIPCGALPYGERYLYFPSAGAALMAAGWLSTRKWGIRHRFIWPILGAFCLLAFSSLWNSSVSWRTAGSVANRLIEGVRHLAQSLDEGENPLIIASLPDTVEGKFCLRNGIEHALWPRQPVPEVPLIQIASHQVAEVGTEKIRILEFASENNVCLVIDHSDQSTAFVPKRPWNAAIVAGEWKLVTRPADVLDQKPWLYSGFSLRFDEMPDQNRPVVIIGLSNGEIIGSEGSQAPGTGFEGGSLDPTAGSRQNRGPEDVQAPSYRSR
jgi:hypothetical protein